VRLCSAYICHKVSLDVVFRQGDRKFGLQDMPDTMNRVFQEDCRRKPQRCLDTLKSTIFIGDAYSVEANRKAMPWRQVWLQYSN
jgi:hypothetical protein